MNRTAALQGVGQVAAPFLLVVGASLATLTVVGTSASGRIAAPAPNVTVTPSPRVVTVPPSPSPSAVPRDTATLVAERPPEGARTGSQPSAASGGAMAAEQNPPSTTTPASSCSGRVVSVRLPLGVLPTCAVTVGGSR